MADEDEEEEDEEDEDEDALPWQERPCSSAVEHSSQKVPVKVFRTGKYNHIKCATTEALSEPAINKDDDIEADEEVLPWHMGPMGPSGAGGQSKDLHSSANIHGKDVPSCVVILLMYFRRC